MIDNIVEGGLAADKLVLRSGMRLIQVAGRPVETLEDAHYFFGAASWPLNLVFQGGSSSPAVVSSPPVVARRRHTQDSPAASLSGRPDRSGSSGGRGEAAPAPAPARIVAKPKEVVPEDVLVVFQHQVGPSIYLN